MKYLTPLLLALAIAAPSTAREPVILAVDGSRSLSGAELGAASSRLADMVDALPPEVPVGVIAFHDRAEWRARPTLARPDIRAALTDMTPRGNRTVLNEALIMASQELPTGGLVLVISDGRDEGSAVTAADVERRYSRLDARILTASMGSAVDDRALRRLSLLTQGRDLGTLGDSTPTSLAAAVESVRQEWMAARAPAEPPPAVATPAPPADSGVRAEQPNRPTSVDLIPHWVLAAGIGIVALLGLLAIVSAILRLRPTTEDDATAEETREGPAHCPTCGAVLADWETSCSACEIGALEEAARTRQVESDRHPTGVDGDVIVDPGLTMAVADLGYLVLEGEARPGPRYALPRSETFTVGRAPEVNSLQIDDPTVSAQHFKVVPRDDQFYIVDLDTTNGTTVNHEQVRVRRLCAGDVIRAGLCEFRFELAKSPIN
jgi:hypothetical protein